MAARPLPQPLAKVTASLGGVNAEVLYAGAAPGLIAGVMQVNLVVPGGLSGAVSVVLTVGGVASQGGVTVMLTGH